MKQPETIMDWILPFREQDNEAWRKANLLGKICFPAYLIIAACRTIFLWALMLALLPAIPIIAFEESKYGKAFEKWCDRMFDAAFCKESK